MPRIKEFEKQYMVNDLYVWIEGQRVLKKLKQTDLAEKMGLSQQTLSYRLIHKSLTVQDIISIFEVFEADEETIIKFIKTKN